jgi:molecular chaperone HscA
MARIAIDISGGRLKQENIIVGIDLGTTNSLIAQVVDGKPVCIADIDRGVMVPSMWHFGSRGEVTIGEDAKPYLYTDPQNTLYSVKRLIGKTYQEVHQDIGGISYKLVDAGEDQPVRVAVRAKEYSPIELSSLILKELRQRAEHRLKTEIKQAVITVPAYFNDGQRNATREAGRLSGLDVLRIVNEPTAAALAYGLGLDPAQEATVVVYDLGGGTFDVTILRIHEGLFDVLSTHGDTHLGGDDFDRAIVEHWLSELNLPASRLEEDKLLGQAIRLLAETAKKHLGEHPMFEGTLPLEEGATTVRLEQSTFSALAQPLIARTLDSCRKALKDAELKSADIHEIVLVGGSTRMPLVKQALTDFFGRTPQDHLNPDEVVALGAAIQADILAGNRKDLLLLDVTPLSLGIETSGGLMDVIIPRNSKVPNRATRRYSTGVDGQVNLRVSVYQGEREQVAHNRKLASFDLRGIPAMPAGLPLVDITFMLDADGILRVEATEARSGVRQEVRIAPAEGLTDEEMERMLLESLQHAEQDIATRMELEVQEEGRQLVYNAQRFLTRYARFFEGEEQANTQKLIESLESAIAAGEKAPIQRAIDELEVYTKPFAERVMNEAVQAAMVGRVV